MRDQKFNQANEQKKLAPINAKNDVTHALRLKLHEQKADLKWL